MMAACPLPGYIFPIELMAPLEVLTKKCPMERPRREDGIPCRTWTCCWPTAGKNELSNQLGVEHQPSWFLVRFFLQERLHKQTSKLLNGWLAKVFFFQKTMSTRYPRRIFYLQALRGFTQEDAQKYSENYHTSYSESIALQNVPKQPVISRN